MKLKDVTIGSVFTIENTPSYPKLKTAGGYVDMRDEIIIGHQNDEREVEIMTTKQIAKQFDDTVEEAEKWVKELTQKYIK